MLGLGMSAYSWYLRLRCFFPLVDWRKWWKYSFWVYYGKTGGGIGTICKYFNSVGSLYLWYESGSVSLLWEHSCIFVMRVVLYLCYESGPVSLLWEQSCIFVMSAVLYLCYESGLLQLGIMLNIFLWTSQEPTKYLKINRT